LAFYRGGLGLATEGIVGKEFESHRYLAEFQYRFNRRFNMRTILARLLHALVAATASPERRLRLAEAP
jgi:hypothetical protein